jgi:hypothetical protein
MKIKSEKHLFVRHHHQEPGTTHYLCWLSSDRPTKTKPASIYVWNEGHISTSEYGDYDQDDVANMISELTKELEIA